MTTASKYANQVRRLPVEIDRLKARGREAEAQRAQEHLDRARAQVARRGRR